ncbi:hybrid sensor histidine kinase/response regulator transcription factor [Echinicola strongylocentroti]|nr:two-component regulator propeller domain-containing protein [Echinicola strongylocentroti]
MDRWTYLLTVLVISCFVSRITAQETTNLKFKKIGTEDGLSSSSVIDILQDYKGFIWFGTRDGLNKFDGEVIKTYHNELHNDSTLRDNWVSSLFEDSAHHLWISTLKGVSIYNEDLDKIIRVVDKDKILEGLRIAHITESKNNEILLSSKKGLFSLKFNYEENGNLKLNRLVSQPVISSYIEEEVIWTASPDGIYRYNIASDQLEKVFDYNSHFIPYNFHVDFHKLKDKLLLSSPIGLFQWDKSSASFTEYKFINAENNIHSFTSAVRKVVKDANGLVWVGTINGLYIINPSSKKTTKYIHRPQDLYSLSHNSVYDILEDNDNNIWIGTWAGGVNFFDRNLVTFNHYYSSETKFALSNNIVSSFVEDEPNEFWIGTEGGGLNYFDRKSGQFKKVDYRPANEPPANIKKIIKDKAGNLWIGLHYHGLEKYHPKTGEYRLFKHQNSSKNSLSNNTVMSLFEDKSGRIWIGTNEGGLNQYLGGGEFERYDNESWYANMTVFTIHEKRAGLLLLGTNKGLIEFNVNQKTFKAIPIKSDILDQEITVHSLFTENDSLYWLGTSSHGLIKYNDINNQVKTYHTANGLPNNLIYGILKDDSGNLWISTNNGLSKFNPQNEDFTNYGIKNGLQSSVFNYNSFLKTSNGDLMFGGINGFNIFDPNNLIHNQGSNPLYITSIKIFDKELAKGKNEVTRNVSNMTEITLQPPQFNFTINYTSINFTTPERTQFQYKLEGFDNKWISAGNQRFANYNNIAPGDYTFMVRTKPTSKGQSVSQARLKIIVLPPWWMTKWAYFFYSLIVAGLIYVFWKFKSSQFEMRKKLLQNQLDTENEKHLYNLKLKFFTNISHELKTPLTLILGPAEELISHEWKSNTLKEKVHLLYSQSKKMYHLVNQLLEFRKTETGNTQLRATEGDISQFINEIYLVFKLKAEKKGIQYTFKSIDHEIPIFYDRDKLEMVFTNLLSNAFKHTHEGGVIKIDVDYTGSTTSNAEFANNNLANNFATISITDNGTGMTPEETGKIFDRFHQTFRSETLSVSGTGIGLSLVKDLIDLHRGEIVVKSALQKGTCFVIKLPFGKEHLSPEQILEDIDPNAEHTFYKDYDIQKDRSKIELKNAQNNPYTILLVDDNPDLLQYLKELLMNSFTIFCAENGKEALELIKQSTIDLIISDVMMPEMDGITLCQKVNEDKSLGFIPFILLTARTAAVYEIEGLVIGATDYIAKPFNPKILQAKIQNIFINKIRLQEFYEKSILQEHYDLDIPNEEKDFIESSIKIVEEYVEDPTFNVQALARSMAMSQSSYYKKLKSLTGKTAVEFIRDVRVRVAAQLLLNSNFRISDIAQKVGISDTKYFRESFKKTYGISPSKYKTSKKQDELTSKNQPQ